MFSELSGFRIMSRMCTNYPDKFCYICSDITFKTQRKNLTPLVFKLYEQYSGFAIAIDKKRTI